MICVFFAWLLIAFAATLGFQGFLFQKAAAWGNHDVGLWRATWVSFLASVCEGLFELACILAWFGIPPDLHAMSSSWMPWAFNVVGFVVFIAVVAWFLDLEIFESVVLGLRFILIQMILVVALCGAIIVGGIYTGFFGGLLTQAVVGKALQPQSQPMFQPVPSPR